jgi:hypothetical protein
VCISFPIDASPFTFLLVTIFPLAVWADRPLEARPSCLSKQSRNDP